MTTNNTLSGQFDAMTYSNTPTYKPPSPFDGLVQVCKVLKVYDGDTITVGLIIEGKLVKQSCRCLKYNSAEMKPKKGTPEEKLLEKEKGVAARDFLARRILDREIVIQFHIVDPDSKTKDPYGRPLINFTIPGEKKSVSEFMIKHGHGAPYFGKGEKTF